ncbi:unnamed protein product [Ranitomeya imitator]|uniref:Helix-turn-helix domain-containing protein n=1 Tax=Ranitomeya imitator TaxID=111125 RepID=A0ABN9LZJ1_9NEOB|nr:unnamed protein product [Ranitomeya imitator]
MELITKHEEIEINHIKDDITKIQTSLNKYNNVEDFNILNQRMEKNLLKLEEHVADIKHDKFQRDKRDYELNQVYTWKISRTWNRRNRRPQHDFFDSNYKGRRVSFTASHESMGSSSSNHNTSEDFSDVSFGSNRHNETFNERSGAISKAKNAGGGRGGSTNELLDYSILRDLQSDSLEKDCNMSKDFGTPNALFYPVQSRPTVLDTFQELVERDLMKLDSNIDFVHDNLTVLERQAIINENTNLVAVSPYRKSTDSNSILEAHSCHPKHVIKNIPVGEFIRLKRNCSSAAQFTQETESAVFRLKDRGYPNWMLHRAKSVTKDIDRKSLLWSDNEDSGSLSRNPNKNNNKMKKIKRKRLNENKHTEPASHSLSTINFSTVYSPHDVKLAHILDRTHIRYLAKKAPSLRDILSPSLYLHSKLTAGNSAWLTYKGFFKCGHHPCKTCNFVRKTTSFTSSVTGITYPIRTHMNCNSEGVIYLIECDLCKLQYVGCTVGPLKRRFCKHISESALNNTSHNISAVSHHCKTIHAGNTSMIKVTAIEKVHKPPRGGDHRRKILNRESFWIFSLQSRVPLGLNKRLDLILQLD